MSKNIQSNYKALSGIRILDLTRVLAGPFCTMILADLGAEVIKLEVPKKGDDTRQYPPFIKSESAYFMNLNRNKKSLTLNLKHPQGKEVFQDLVKKVDVVVENFRPTTMERLGLGYENLKEINPKIIYASISGFGHYGRYKDRPGYDIIGQAMGGIMSVTGWPGGPPTRTGTAIADILAALNACIGILSALKYREATGEGQEIDVSLVDAVVFAMETLNQIYIVEKRIPKREGNRYEFIYPYDSFKAQDDWFVLGVGNDNIWERFCKVINKENLINNEEFNSNNKRVKNHIKIKKIVEEWASNKKVNEIVSIFLANRIPCAPIYSVAQVVNDQHIANDREMFLEIEHPTLGRIKLGGNPIKMSKTNPIIYQLPPFLGQNTEDVLREMLSYSKEKIGELKYKGVI
ncbi:carnitine dehydratase [Candidatus Atribacteria bacterium HGW-Atribacteria-1]|nr:MAG: carnitine dehydratase [Candidatus Atribacteria bacterium HGW-Atribacteria-1]